MNRFQRWQTQRRLRHYRIPLGLWEHAAGDLLHRQALQHSDRRRLRELASLFLHEKTITAAGGLELDSSTRVSIAAAACLLILNIGLDYYSGWIEVIVYPGDFVVTREECDDAGVVHRTRRILAGEAWLRGPVILSWADRETGSHPSSSNAMLHEFAHKLDMLTGSANGMPPLHPNMNRQNWTDVLSKAYRHLCARVEQHGHSTIDPYAAVSPAEFFAVMTEAFFEQPADVHHLYPDVYRQLRLFYRQDPLGRQSSQRV